MWLPWDPVHVNNYLIAAKEAKVLDDRLTVFKQQKESGNGEQQQEAPTTNRTKLVNQLCKVKGRPWRINFQQNALCNYCQSFLLLLLAENARLGDTTELWQLLSNDSNKLIYCRPRTRSFSAVLRSWSRQDCWICTQVVNNRQRDASGAVTTFATSLHALNFTPDSFKLASFGRKVEQTWIAEFHIKPVESESASLPSHRIFDVLKRTGELIVDSLAQQTASAALLHRDYALWTTTWPSDGLEKASVWLKTCEKHHVRCRRVEGDISATAYPSRVLDLSKSGSGVVQLVDGDVLPLEGAEYATLSHRWGDVRQAILLKANLEVYRRGLLISTLPQTFSDAIRVCRDLEIRYLWIDSLCIVQDNKGDWETEAPRMAEIFTNSRITLAATASCRDADGLLNPLDPALVSPLIFKIETGDDDDENSPYFSVERDENFNGYVNDAPLNERAWVLQERALSRRILHFASDQLYWQCASGVQAQFDVRFDPANKFVPGHWQSMMQWNHCASDSTDVIPVSNIDQDQKLIDAPCGQPTDPAFLSKWDDLVQVYSRCMLTYTSDKLTAIAGLAKRVQTLASLADSDYLAGLWRQGLPRRLLWAAVDPSCKRPNLEIPTWSWAHINDAISWSRKIWTETVASTGNVVADLLSASTRPVRTALDSVSGGWITLKAPLCRIRLHRSLLGDDVFAAKVHHDGKWVKIFDPADNPPLEMSFDRKTSWTMIFGRDIFFMPILDTASVCRDGESLETAEHHLYGLMLEPTGSKNGQYRRVGFLVIEPKAYQVVNEVLPVSRLDPKFFEQVVAGNKYVLEII